MKKAVICVMDDAALDVSHRPSKYVAERSKIAPVEEGWKRTLPGQSGARGTRRRDRRVTRGKKKSADCVAEILRREPISLIIICRERHAEPARAFLASFLACYYLLLTFIYFV